MATIVSSLEHKTNLELNNLRLKLRNQLQKDIFRLYSDSVFADFLINVENEAVKSHRCILQTRAPTFYSTYCQKPDLVKVVPCQKLKIFLREIYCDTEIRSKENELLKCIESAFPIDRPVKCGESNDFEQSNYFSINDSFVSASTTKLNLLQDISKSSSCVNYSYFRNSDNTAYYSLVDESLILSDFSDINEEAPKRMSDPNDFANSITSEMDVANRLPSVAGNPAETKCISENVDSVQTSVAERINIDDLLPSAEKVEKPEKATLARKFFSYDGDDVGNLNVGQSGSARKFFIDASDLLDEDTANSAGDKIPSFTESIEIGTSRLLQHQEPNVKSKCSASLRSEKLCEKQTPDSLDDDPQLSNDCSDQLSPAELRNKLENDFHQASLAEKESLILRCEQTPLQNCCENAHSFSSIPISAISFAAFKTYLIEKYECAKKNHAYSDDELQRLKIFDELVQRDDNFTYLRHDLEEILVSDATKTRIAMHKFLVKQYEKHHKAQTTYATVKTLMMNILEEPGDNTERKFGQTYDSLYDDGGSKQINGNDDNVAAIDVDELFKKLLKTSTRKEKKPEPTNKVIDAKEQVTNKSCGFFIDLKESPKPVFEAKEKSLPSKQLFSMFIDFGNSTDSDSSIEVHNRFERRKKQYISKLEKSRELRNSVTSLNDVEGVGGGRKLEKIVQSTPMTCSTAEKLIEDVTIDGDTSTVVLRRSKNNNSTPYLQTVRRSWNVDKTSEINQNTVTKHKRSYSVSARQYGAAVDVSSYMVDVNLNREDGTVEFPPIGNADSTNELTVNGESEVSNTYSYSEGGDTKTQSSISNSVSAKACSNGDRQPKSEENCSKTKEKGFVKLSDMDKEPKTLSSTDHWSSLRMTKSAISPDTNWFETKLLNGSVNSRSLSRIFPDLSANVLSKPNSDVDDTTVSSMSSVQSSSAVSTCESNLELSNNASKSDNNTLGQDLLKMFVDEISTDVVVEVAGRRIKAHKCILTSRCQYFAALLSGGWVESAGNVLSIHGFSYNVVRFALCYIYSAENEIPENISIVELASLADYLCLEGLKEVVSYTLKMRYCHFFHKPCNICSVGVLECLPIAVNYGLDDIHRKSLRWITKHYVRLWSSKAFATLPRELIDKCYNQHVVNMTVNNVFETLTNCDKLFSFIPQTRWAEPCFAVTRKLHDYCIKFMANHFVEFLKSDAFLSIATNRTWGIIIMDEKTQLVCGKMRSDQLCQSYAYLSGQCKLAMASHENEELIELLNRVKHQIETTLVKIALQACQCTAWFQMDPELRTHIQTSAGLTFVPNEVKRRVETSKPRPSTISSGSRGVDLQQVKTVINRQHRQTNNVRAHELRSSKQGANQKSNVHHSRSSSAKQNSSQNKENKGSSVKASSHVNSKSPFRNKYANVKSRYMEHNSGSKNDRTTASETTPSETSEAERRPPVPNKRPSKSLASSVHLSPGACIRQTVRAVSLSKIPVSMRNSSQKRTDSDRDTTSGSDNGVRPERRAGGVPSSAGPNVNGAVINGTGDGNSARAAVAAKAVASTTTTSSSRRRLTSSHSTSVTRSAHVASSRASNALVTMRKSYSSAGAADAPASRANRSGRAQSAAAGSRRKATANGAGAVRRKNNVNQTAAVVVAAAAPVPVHRSKESSPDTKCPSNPSCKTSSTSEEIVRPDVPFRRDGTFCIDEPTVLQKHSPSCDVADVI